MYSKWRLRRLSGITLLAASATSCESATRGEFETWAFMVYGVITDAGGAPLPGMVVEYELYRPTCEGGARSGGDNTAAAASDAEGYYRRQVLVLHPSPEQCLRVIARLGNGTRHVGGEVTGLPLKPVSESSLPYDSVRVDIVLP